MQRWILTDLHLNHVNMAKKYRPADYQSQLVRNCQVIAPDDEVEILGDIIMGKTEPYLAQFMAQIPGIKHGVRGNHDHRSDHTYCSMGFATFDDARVVPSSLGDIYLTHKPAYCLLPDTVLNVHGHLHDDFHRLDEYKGEYPEPWHRLLSLELAGYKPVLLEEFIRTRGHFERIK